MKSKRIAGILGLSGAVVFIAAAVVSILTFERGTYSLMNCFVTELGLYTGDYMAASSALVFNIGLILFGLAFGVSMIINGLRGETLLNTAASFFGVLSGILLAAQGLFSLNFYTYHYVIASAFFITLFITCVLYIVSNLLSGDCKRGLVSTIIAFLTAAAAVLSAGYMISGGMAQVFSEDALSIGRANIIPFAIIGWVAYALLLIFTAVLSIRMFEKENSEKLESGSVNKKQPKLKAPS